MSTWSKFHTEDLQILCVTKKDLSARSTFWPFCYWSIYPVCMNLLLGHEYRKYLQNIIRYILNNTTKTYLNIWCWRTVKEDSNRLHLRRKYASWAQRPWLTSFTTYPAGRGVAHEHWLVHSSSANRSLSLPRLGCVPVGRRHGPSISHCAPGPWRLPPWSTWHCNRKHIYRMITKRRG